MVLVLYIDCIAYLVCMYVRYVYECQHIKVVFLGNNESAACFHYIPLITVNKILSPPFL